MLGNLGRLTHRHQLLGFFVLTYAISWVIWWAMAASALSIATPIGWALNIIATAGPTIAAVALAVALGGGALGRLLSGFSIRRTSVGWALVALVLPLAMIALAIALSVGFMGGATPVVSVAVLGSILFEWIRVVLVGGPLEEEAGWRGFRLPRLQDRWSAFSSAVLLGLLWGLWHIPLYFVPGTGQFDSAAGGSAAFSIGAFVVWTMGLSVLFAWLLNQSRGSLIVVVLFHASVNTGSFMPSAVSSTGAASLLYVLITWVVALLVVWRDGSANLAAVPRQQSG